jgi:type IV fimbrial biogenesis protein FimT
MHDKKGFTLIELMVTLVVAAILLIVGVPSFQELIKSNRMTSRVNTFVTGLHYARSEAAKRGSRVTLCKSADLGNCTTSGGWEQGWILFTDEGTAGTLDGNDAIISAFHPEPSDVTIRGNNFVKNRISYLSSGIVEPSNGTVIVCDDRIKDYSADKAKARAIIISKAGRIRMAKGDNNTVSVTTCTPS